MRDNEFDQSAEGRCYEIASAVGLKAAHVEGVERLPKLKEIGLDLAFLKCLN